MKKIKEEEYVKALSVVRKYITQIREEMDSPHTLTSPEDWCKIQVGKYGYVTNLARLINCLKANSERIEAIELIAKKDFMRFRNAGKSSWDLFTELRGY